MRTLRYAIIGTGMMGHEHIRNLALVKQMQAWDVQIVALIDPDQQMRESAVQLAFSLGHAEAVGYSSLDEVALDTIDAFVIVSPNFTHHEVITRLLPTGKAILAEKPICTTLPQCDDLLMRLDDYPSPFWVAMEYRYMPPTARFIERLQSGAIGTLRMLAIREHRFPFLVKVGDWNRFSENTGGTLVEKCCHHFDLMRLMVGAEPVRVFASGAMDVNHLDERYDGRTPDILDNAYVIVDFANGVRASLDLCMFADGAEPQEQLTAIGELGKLDAFIPGPDRFWPDAGERKARVVFSPRDRSPQQVDLIDVDEALAAAGDHHGSTYFQHVQFARAILEGTPVAVSAEDGVIAVRMGAAAQESIRTGQVVELSIVSKTSSTVATGTSL
jgi:myo-inositol 2-dehydrogenase / D-chiro-inositol 1-dehydrogenase